MRCKPGEIQIFAFGESRMLTLRPFATTAAFDSHRVVFLLKNEWVGGVKGEIGEGED